MAVYHVSLCGSDFADGSEKAPFRNISKAASEAEAGDTVIVHEGEYREWVRPANSGKKTARITYMAAPGEKVVIKGSERIQGWESCGGGVWSVCVPDSFFPYGNPFAVPLAGDWLIWPEDRTLHLGDVYLNGKSMYEAFSEEEVRHPLLREEGMAPPWTGRPEKIPDSSFTVYVWYAEVRQGNTVILANFHGADPNRENVEISVRPAVFYPERTNVNAITVRGFVLCQAATQWAPPTADQPGLIGPHWAKDWIIENCEIYNSKCAGISLGKEASTGNNESTRWHYKPGYHTQAEVVFRALDSGWSKENIGGHIVRGNRIHDCGQTGIVGHMGGAFSEISGNEIWNIGVKHEFFGYEIAGIKLHAALDTQIHGNWIHDTTLGLWLDWEAQGVRVSRNIFCRNARDLFVEVTHGPYTVDNNIFASEYNFDNIAQGGAFLYNLFCGVMRREAVMDRSTPYHFPHSTKVAGISFVYSGDDRIYRNIYAAPGGSPSDGGRFICGTAGYDGAPVSLQEFAARVTALGNGDHDMFAKVPQPVYISGNAYCNGAPAFAGEADALFCTDSLDFRLEEDGGCLYAVFAAGPELADALSAVPSSAAFPVPRITECAYENPDGTPLVFTVSLTGDERGEKSPPGPFAALAAGENRILVWPGNAGNGSA